MLQARYANDACVEVGIDEAGRGSFWGPIVAGAVILPAEPWTEEQRNVFKELRDSKRISPKKRERLADELIVHVRHGIGMVHAAEINEHGIQWANREAFRRAIHGAGIEDEVDVRLLLDGSLGLEDWKGEQQVIVEGDNQYIAIAGASILAKVSHDRWIINYAKEHPECQERYDIMGSKGYGTVLHREGIKRYGGHELHRSLYIQRWLPGVSEAEQTSRTRMKGKGKAKANTKEIEVCLIRFQME